MMIFGPRIRKKFASGLTTVARCPYCPDRRAGAVAVSFDAALRQPDQQAHACQLIDLDRRPPEADQAVVFAPDLGLSRPCPHLVRIEVFSSFTVYRADSFDAPAWPPYLWLREIGLEFGPQQQFLFDFLTDVVQSTDEPTIKVKTPHRIMWPYNLATGYRSRHLANRCHYFWLLFGPGSPYTHAMAKVDVCTFHAKDVDAYLAEIASSPRFKAWRQRAVTSGADD